MCRKSAAHPISECLNTVDSPEGRQRIADSLQGQPFPHYDAHSDESGLLVRIEENGRRTVGRFVNRTFQPVKLKTKAGRR